MFKVESEKIRAGNNNIASTCPKGHTSFKKAGAASSAYKCPYCGHDVP